MNRRTLLSTLAGFFVGKKVVKPFTASTILVHNWPPVLEGLRGIEGPVGPVGMPGPIGCCGHQGPCDCPKETEAEHAQRWADAEEWNRRWEKTNAC